MSKTHSEQHPLLRTIKRLREIKLISPLLESILPRLRLLKEETVELEIQMAPYRLMAAEWGSIASAAMAVIAAPVAILAWLLQWPPGVRIGAVLFAGASLFLLFESLRQVILHEQWRFIVTNKRIILITPDPQRHGLADAIYLKRGKIQVVDTNWSSSPVWGLFQSITGSRDVLLSLAGYEFQTKGAVVKGGLRFPDVAPSDIAKLEELIFG